MKFGVVEYSSKTKKIWRHTAARPNYLCDPVKEIDPTSFGCYVSALEGEHLPLTFFITGDEVGIFKKVYRKIVKRFTAHWPETYDISYLGTFDALLVVYQISDGHEVVSFLHRMKKEYPHIPLIGVPTQPYGILEEYWNEYPEKKEEIIRFMDGCDLFLTIVESTTQLWQSMTRTKVLYAPQPYPVEFAEREWKPRAQKRNVIYVAGVTDRNNIIRGEIVAKQLQKKFPEYRIQMSSVDGIDPNVSELTGSTYDILPFLPWQEHLAMLSKVALVINTDYTYTRGRVQVDCAAVGTPSIGANSDGQDDLFPKLRVTQDTSIEQLVLQGQQLLQDASYYDEVMRTAKERLWKYNYTESQKRMLDIIAQCDFS